VGNFGGIFQESLVYRQIYDGLMARIQNVVASGVDCGRLRTPAADAVVGEAGLSERRHRCRGRRAWPAQPATDVALLGNPRKL
jgi:hypothetical protein